MSSFASHFTALFTRLRDNFLRPTFLRTQVSQPGPQHISRTPLEPSAPTHVELPSTELPHFDPSEPLTGFKRAFVAIALTEDMQPHIARFRSHVWPVVYPAEAHAVCLTTQTHVPPTNRCTCGFYALLDRDTIASREFAGSHNVPPHATSAVLTAQLYGDVVEGVKGFRARSQTVFDATLDSWCTICFAPATVLGVDPAHRFANGSALNVTPSDSPNSTRGPDPVLNSHSSPDSDFDLWMLLEARCSAHASASPPPPAPRIIQTSDPRHDLTDPVAPQPPSPLSSAHPFISLSLTNLSSLLGTTVALAPPPSHRFTITSRFSRRFTTERYTPPSSVWYAVTSLLLAATSILAMVTFSLAMVYFVAGLSIIWYTFTTLPGATDPLNSPSRRFSLRVAGTTLLFVTVLFLYFASQSY